LPANLILKHLAVLSDYGGEPIKRLGTEFEKIFPINAETQSGKWFSSFAGATHEYVFKALSKEPLSYAKLSIDGKRLAKPVEINDVLCDMIMILLHGSTSTASHLASLEKCELGAFLGKTEDIETYVSQKYLVVSRITTGASANSLGQFTQTFVANHIRNKLANDYAVTSNGRVKLNSYDSERGMPFDVVVERGGRTVGIEVSFQVTSNSVIERKAASAEDRKNHMGRAGHFVAYVLDGAGNFSRRAAMTAICQSSDCTVAFSDEELDTLADFIKGKLDDPVR
jgi:hypothetical protein